jgi:hypothetical protein
MRYSPAATSPRTVWLVWGTAQLGLGLIILGWMFAFGVHDESSLGEVFFLWGSLLTLLILVLPAGAMLLWARGERGRRTSSHEG